MNMWFVFVKGPAGPIGAPGVRGEDGNPGPRVSEAMRSTVFHMSGQRYVYLWSTFQTTISDQGFVQTEQKQQCITEQK